MSSTNGVVYTWIVHKSTTLTKAPLRPENTSFSPFFPKDVATNVILKGKRALSRVSGRVFYTKTWQLWWSAQADEGKIVVC